MLLFDQNVSARVLALVKDDFPDSTHVSLVGLSDAADKMIFEFARNQGYAIVTFDSDFVDISIVHGAPPQVIWLRTGNLTTRSISELLRANASTIRAFLGSEEAILEILRDNQ